MKTNKLFIASLFLLAILSLGAINASDVPATDSADALGIQEDVDLTSDIDDVIEDGSNVDDILEDSGTDNAVSDENGLEDGDGNDETNPSGTQTDEDSKDEGIIKYSESTVYDRSGEIASLYLPIGAEGNLIVEVDGELYGSADFLYHGEIEEDEFIMQWDGAHIYSNRLPIGLHNIHAYYDGTDYEVEPVDYTFNVYGAIHTPKNDTVISCYDDSNIMVYLNLPEDAAGTLYVSSKTHNYNVSLKSGSGNIFIKTADIGTGIHDFNAYFISDSEKYNDIAPVNFTVKLVPKIFFYQMKVFSSSPVVVTTFNKDVNGKCVVTVDNKKNFTKALQNGEAKVYISNLTAGNHLFTVNYYDDSGKLFYTKEETIAVQKAQSPKIEASNLTMYYKDGSAFKVKVLGTDGKPIVNGSVVIKINNKKVKTVKTNSKGIATYTIANLPKKYTISASYGKVNVTRKLTVKQPLTLKTVKVKKSAKKLVLTATLKGKKAYVGKKVVFKFNGKKYSAKTNKKGIAKVTIKKAVLKKLKVGKKITYQVTFSKDTVKKTAKVKK